MNIRLLALGALLCLVGSSSASAAFYLYEIDSMAAAKLGTLGGEDAVATDINNTGQIVGWSTLSNGVAHAFLINNGVMQDITASLGSMRAFARGINNNMEVVGYYVQPVGTTHVDKPFYWSVYEVNPRTLPMNGTGTQAHAINDHGRIVGNANGEWPDACDFRPVAVQWGHAYAPIERIFCPNTLDLPVHANDVNNAGLIVGWHNQQQIQYGWTWHGLLDPVPINPGNTCQHWAYGTNESGEVVGAAEACAPPNHRRAFIWDGIAPTTTSLGTLSGGTTSTAREINDQRFVVGSANAPVKTGPTTVSLLNRAFIWHANFGMQPLPLPKGLDPKDTHCGANAVSRRNEAGLIQVVGTCSDDGVNHAIRWDVMTSKHLWIPQL